MNRKLHMDACNVRKRVVSKVFKLAERMFRAAWRNCVVHKDWQGSEAPRDMSHDIVPKDSRRLMCPLYLPT